MRRAAAILQIQEFAAAIFLVWIALHVPGAALCLIGAAGLLVVWAASTDGPLGIAPLLSVAVHRRGLLVIGAVIIALPVATGRWTDPLTLVPAMAVGALMIRNGLIRAGVEESPEPMSRLDGPGAGDTPLPDATRRTIHRAGRTAGRAGSVIARQADVAVPAGARVAGRVAGRLHRASKR